MRCIECWILSSLPMLTPTLSYTARSSVRSSPERRHEPLKQSIARSSLTASDVGHLRGLHTSGCGQLYLDLQDLRLRNLLDGGRDLVHAAFGALDLLEVLSGNAPLALHVDLADVAQCVRPSGAA